MSDYSQPIRIRPPERDAAGNVETPLSPDEVRVAIREGWAYTADVFVLERRRVQVINFEEQAA
jgi:hypothetical protein